MRNDYYDGPVTPVPEITEIQALLVMHTKRDGTPEDGTTPEQWQALWDRLWLEFMNSPLGISLYNRGGQKVFDRVLEVYTERYSLRPSLDYLGALEEISRDLITDELPEPPKVETTPGACGEGDADPSTKSRQCRSRAEEAAKSATQRHGSSHTW